MWSNTSLTSVLRIDLQWVTSAGNGSSAVADILIAASLCFYLHINRTGHRKCVHCLFSIKDYRVTKHCQGPTLSSLPWLPIAWRQVSSQGTSGAPSLLPVMFCLPPCSLIRVVIVITVYFYYMRAVRWAYSQFFFSLPPCLIITSGWPFVG